MEWANIYKIIALGVRPKLTYLLNFSIFQVSICKFKFTGGPKPTLEEKKMLHIDSEGNFCYTTGSGDRAVTGFEYFPKEVIHANAAIVTDAFTSLP